MLKWQQHFDKHAPKYGTEHIRCSLKYVAKFQQKCWQNTTVSFAPFALSQYLYAMRK
jgi:hypothetical protein